MLLISDFQSDQFTILVSSIDEVSSNSKSGDKWSFVLAISFLVVYGILWI